MSEDDKALAEQIRKLFDKSSFLQTLAKAALGPATTLIITVGSAGGKETDPQKCPAFAKQLIKSESETLVEILNIDPIFHSASDTDHGFVERLSQDKLQVYAYDIRFASEGIFAKCVLKVLSDILEKTNKKLVLQYCCSPQLTPVFYECAKKYVNKIGEQLAIIGAYHHNQPVILYLSEAFKKFNTGQAFYMGMMQALWTPLWSTGTLDASTFEALEKSAAETGYLMLFKDISQMPVNALFPNNKPKPRMNA
jgi:hypothetical protein